MPIEGTPWGGNSKPPDQERASESNEFSAAVQSARELARSVGGVTPEQLDDLRDAFQRGLTRKELDTLLELAFQLERAS